MDKYTRYLKQWVLDALLKKERKKREMDKIAHVFLQKYFQVSNKRDMF